MPHTQNINIQEENEFRKITNLIFKNYRLFILSVFIALVIAFSVNRYSIPTYSVSSSILIKGNNAQSGGGGGSRAGIKTISFTVICLAVIKISRMSYGL